MIKLILLFVVFLNFIASILVVSREGNNTRYHLFCTVSFFASIWAFSNYMTGVDHSLVWLSVVYSSSVFVVATSFFWVSSVVRQPLLKLRIVLGAGITVLLAIACFIPSFLVAGDATVYLGGVFSGRPGYGFYIYCAFFLVTVSVMLAQLYFAKQTEVNPKRKIQFVYVFWGMLLMCTLFVVTNFILPRFSVFKLGAIPSIGFLLFLTCTAYSLIRYEIQSEKIITAELSIFSLWAFMLVQLFTLERGSDQIMGVLVILIACAVGIQLRRSVVRGVQQAEELEQAGEDLRNANKEITETNQQLHELNTLKTEFLSFATHQLRSPLAAVQGYAEMLEDGGAGKISTQQKKIVRAMREATTHLSSTVEDFLDVAKIEQGGMQYLREDFDISSVVRECVTQFALSAKRKKISLSFTQDTTRSCNVRGDREKIRQVVSNLIDNAIKYTEEGSVFVELKHNAGAQSVLSVSDTGRGIDPHFQEDLFHKFARSSGGGARTTGSGLGLFLAKQIVEAHGWQIGVVSGGSQKGSKFYIVIQE